MKTSFNILVATDYSPAAAAAEHYAIRLAMATGSTIRFVHVFKPELADTNSSFDIHKIDDDPVLHQYEKLCDYISGVMDSMHIQPGTLSYKCTVKEGGNIHKQLLRESDEEEIDFIITGAHEAASFKEQILGNHTWSIIRNAEIPVLAVPENAVFSGIDKLVFATEYREGEIPAIQLLTQLAKVFDAEVTVLHIITNTGLSKDFETMLFERFRKEVKSRVTYDKLNIRLIHHERVIDGLNSYCEQQGINWLVMSPEHLSWLDRLFDPGLSVSKQMGFHTHTPLFILPDLNDSIFADMANHS